MSDQHTTEREALAKRTIPSIQLSTRENPLTAPPAPFSDNVSADDRAKMRFEIKGNAVVTGGLGGLGLASARALLEHGLSGLALWDINPSQSGHLVDSLRSDFPKARIITVSCNVTSSESITSALKTTLSELPNNKLDRLLHFAGIVHSKHASEMTADEFRKIIDVNTTGAFLCSQAIGNQIIAQKTRGSITLIASISAHRVNFPQPQVSYNASKGAILQLTRSLAAEWARYGIRVNSISPGYMDTILNEGEGLEKMRAIWRDRNPMGRMGQPGELSGAVVLLSSEAGSFITGADLVVDGGGMVF